MGRNAFEDRAIEVLKSKGYRITMPRLQVLRTLHESEKPLNAQAIHERIVGQGDRIDVVSIYRILAALNEVNLVHHIGVVDAYSACCMEDDHAHESEHFVCTECGGVTELTVPEATLRETRKHLEGLGLKPAEIKIEVLGQCAQCSA